MFNRIHLWDFLSFGRYTEDEVELGTLNILIGPNGSGKSNFIEAFVILRECLGDLSGLLRSRGRFDDWRWRGARNAEVFALKTTVDRRYVHEIQFGNDVGPIHIVLEDVAGPDDPSLKFVPPDAVLRRSTPDENGSFLSAIQLDEDQSVLAQLRDPIRYPTIDHFVKAYRGIRIYRDWEFGPFSRLRQPVSINVSKRYLLDDMSNLPAVLMRLWSDENTRTILSQKLNVVLEDSTGIEIVERDGFYDWGITFQHTRQIPGWRLSDGTLRWLSLLCILVDPNITGLVCIEEPELGLHPDMIHEIGELLKEASKTRQLIVSTHSAALVGAFSQTPEAIIVFDSENGHTVTRRVNPTDARITELLKREDLGLVWASGAIKGNRW